MSEQKRYTAQEMRERADDVDHVSVDDYGRFFYEKEDAFNPDTVRDMLRYAADIKEENEKLKTRIGEWEYSYGIKSKEAFELKARLEAVVKECEKQIPACRGEDCKCNPTDSGYCDENCHDEIIVHTAVTAILRVARGDGGAE